MLMEPPVLVAMELKPQDKKGEILDFAKIASAYGKKTIQNAINTSEILYVDSNKKRTDTWLDALRLQLLERDRISDPGKHKAGLLRQA